MGINIKKYNVAPNGERYLTTKQLCERWDLSENTLRNWRFEGRGPDYKAKAIPGIRVAYMLKDVVEYEKTLMGTGPISNG